MAGATRPVQGGSYSAPRSEPGGQYTPRVGRSTAILGGFNAAPGVFAQQVDQGSIADDISSGIVTAGAGPSYATAVMTDTPVAYWRGGIAAPPVIDALVADQSVNNNGLRIYNSGAGGTLAYPKDAPSLIANDADPAIDFVPDSNLWIANPGPAVLNIAVISIEMWVQPRAGVLSGATFHDLYSRFNQALRIDYVAPNYVFAGVAVDLDGEKKTASSPITAGSTYHLVSTCDGADGSLKLYVNGTLVSTVALRGAITVASNNVVLNQFGAAANASDGVIDEVAVYNYALSPAQVLNHFNKGTGVLTIQESESFADSGAGTVTASGSGTESSTTPTVYTDTGSGTATFSGGKAEAAIYTDSGAGTSTFSGSGTESWTLGYSDSGSGTATFSGAGSESASATDSAAGTSTFSGTRADSLSFSDSGAGTATLSGSGVESWGLAYTDSSSGTTTASGSGTEQSLYSDSASGTATAAGSGSDSSQYGDVGFGSASGAGSGSEAAIHGSASNGVANFTGSGSESYSTAFSYNDSADGGPTMFGFGNELFSYTDAAALTVAVTGGSTEASSSDDASNGNVVFVGDSSEFFDHTGDGSATVTVTGSGSDIWKIGEPLTQNDIKVSISSIKVRTTISSTHPKTSIQPQSKVKVTA